MRPELRLDRRWRRLPGSRFRAALVGVTIVATLTATAVSATASGSPGPRAGHPAPHPALLDTPDTAVPGIPGLPGDAAPVPRPHPQQDVLVTLPTGDRVRLTAPGGSQQATPIPASDVPGKPPAPTTFVQFSWEGDEYVVPDPAVPYLNSTLDPRLFDVSYLARAHLGTTGSTGIPVDIAYTGASQAASVPGLQVNRRSGDTASGTITTAQAIQLGARLAAQWHAAVRHHSAVPLGRLPGVKSISLARAAGAPPLPPVPGRIPAPADGADRRLPYYTLRLNFTGQNGKPGAFAGFVQNVGNVALGTSFIATAFSGNVGSQSLSVPKGTYSLEFSVLTPDSSGTGLDTALVVKPQVSVNSNTTVVLDARTAVPYQATLRPSVNAPARTDILAFWRTSKTGACGGNVEQGCGRTYLSPVYWMYLYSESPNNNPILFSDKLSATPTAPVSEGSFFFDATTKLYSGDNGPAASQYVFDFPHQGTIPSSLTYKVPASALTTVHTDLYAPLSSGPSGGSPQAVTEVYFPVGNGGWSFQGLIANAVAGERTDYWYSGDPDLDLWQYSVEGVAGSYGLVGPILSIRPGQQISASLNRAPLVPSSLAPPFWRAAGLFSQLGLYSWLQGKTLGDPRRRLVCTACRQGDIGTLNVMSYGDSDPGQYEDSIYTGVSSALRFYRDGVLAIETPAIENPSLPLGMELPLLPQPAMYQLDWTLSPVRGAAPPGATIETDWAFRSAPADPAAPLPPSETCAPDTTQPCAFLPLLFPSYDLPLNNSNQATAGTAEPVNFTVTGQQNAPPPPGLSATVSASFDGGQTWTAPQNATSLGNGKFTATISQPALSATNGFVSLRVTAQDGSGDSVTQTITDAYGLTS